MSDYYGEEGRLRAKMADLWEVSTPETQRFIGLMLGDEGREWQVAACRFVLEWLEHEERQENSN